MSSDSLYTIAASAVTLGAVLARGSPGVTLYKADLKLGDHSMQVRAPRCRNQTVPVEARLKECGASQVAVKRLQTCGAPAAAESTFLKEMQTLRLASGTCHRACRLLGCCKLDGDACIVMTLYPKSAARRLEEAAGWSCCKSACKLY